MAQKMFSQNIDGAIALLERVFRNFEQADTKDENRFVSILISKPGLGKSATIAKMADRMGYELIDLNLSTLEPADSVGLGAREKVDGKWQTVPAPPTWVERAMRGNCIIFVDEFNNCQQDILASFQKMFSDFVIDGKKLPRTTHIIGACNPPGKDAIFAAKRLSGAFRRRLCMLPIVDDFEYVMKKHSFKMPRGLMQVNYEELMEYCGYDDISSAVIDNIFNIVQYSEITDMEKVALINGFGEKAFNFAKDMELLSSDVFASGKRIIDEEISYSEWKKEPGDQVTEYQQILWGQESIQNSVSYSRSKKFLSRVLNPSVYVALYSVLKLRFEIEYESDDAKLPDNREIKEFTGTVETAAKAEAASGTPEAGIGAVEIETVPELVGA